MVEKKLQDEIKESRGIIEQALKDMEAYSSGTKKNRLDFNGAKKRYNVYKDILGCRSQKAAKDIREWDQKIKTYEDRFK